MEELFLTDTELEKLTGRKLKSQQIKYLETEKGWVKNVHFSVNARGEPVVTRDMVKGHKAEDKPLAWSPKALTHGA